MRPTLSNFVQAKKFRAGLLAPSAPEEALAVVAVIKTVPARL